MLRGDYGRPVAAPLLHPPPTVASPVQHFSGGPLQLLQDLQQLSVVVTEASPAQDTGQIVPCAQRQHAELALSEKDNKQHGWYIQALGGTDTSVEPIFITMLGFKTFQNKSEPALGKNTLKTPPLLHHHPFSSSSSASSPAYGGSVCPVLRAPSPHCRRLHTPGYETSQTSGKGAG